MLTIAAAQAARNAPGVLPLVCLAAALVVGVVLVCRVLRNLKTEDEEPLTEPGDLLGPLGEAYAAGQMSEEEYRRIRDSALKSGLADTRWTIPVRPDRGPLSGQADPAPGPPPADNPGGEPGGP